jgi:hypothetical protein
VSLPFSPQPKARKGAHVIERREKRKAIEAFEEAEKRKVRARDRACRWPKCEYCRRYKGLRLECAHVFQAKGMGGDHGARSSAADMMLLCRLAHADQEQHARKVEALTERRAAGPCAFWVLDDVSGLWFLEAEEISIGVYRRD